MRGSRVTLVLSLLAGLAFTVPAHADGTGSISGKVTDEAGLPLGDVCVEAGSQESFSLTSTLTEADGTYSLTDLTDGAYALIFRDCSIDRRYLTEWYDSKEDYYAADTVFVSGAPVTGIDASLALGGTVSGVLSDDDGNPAATCVAAFVDTNEWFDVVETGWTNFDDGTYQIGPLPPGHVRLLFGNCDVSVRPERWGFPWGVGGIIRPIPSPNVAPQGYEAEWYDDRVDGLGDLVPVAPGADTPGIDAELALAGGILGVVTDEAGEPIESMCVSAVNAPGSGYGFTDENGFYSITSLAAGSYEVIFYDCSSGTYRAEWFDDQPSALLADAVTVARKTWTKHVDAALGKRPRADLAIQGLRARSVPLEVSGIQAAGSPWLRTIEVDLSNLGTAFPGEEATLKIWAVSESDGRRQHIVEDTAGVRPGATERRSYEWNGRGTVGDVTLYASVCSYDDADRGNNRASARSYVGVGGLGAGARPLGSDPYEFDFCGVIIVPVPRPH